MKGDPYDVTKINEYFVRIVIKKRLWKNKIYMAQSYLLFYKIYLSTCLITTHTPESSKQKAPSEDPDLLPKSQLQESPLKPLLEDLESKQKLPQKMH